MFTYTRNNTNVGVERQQEQSLETKSDTFTVLEPRQDSVLDPHRFESVWTGTQEETIFVKTNMGLGREKALMIQENVEIFAAYIPSRYQRILLYHSLLQHNAEYEKLIVYSCDHISAVLRNEAGSVIGAYGLCYKSTLTIIGLAIGFVTEKDLKLVPGILKCILNELDPRIRIIYMSELLKAEELTKILSALKFHLEETGDCNKVNAYATVKDLKTALQQYEYLSSDILVTVNKLEHYKQPISEQEAAEACLKSRREFEKQVEEFELNFKKLLSAGSLEVTNSYEEFELQPINEQFMFLVKNEDKQITGGILREIEGTQLHGKALWLHESMRGKKLSEKLISLAAQYAKQKGCTDEDLLTCSYNAPWLFPKLGYNQVSFHPMGPHAVYYYKKRL